MQKSKLETDLDNEIFSELEKKLQSMLDIKTSLENLIIKYDKPNLTEALKHINSQLMELQMEIDYEFLDLYEKYNINVKKLKLDSDYVGKYKQVLVNRLNIATKKNIDSFMKDFK